MQYYWAYATDEEKLVLWKQSWEITPILATILTEEQIKYFSQLGYLKRLSRKMDILPDKGAASIPSAEDWRDKSQVKY